MSLRHSLLSLVVLLAVGMAFADGNTESAEDPFGTYTLAGRERYERDPHVAKATMQLDEDEAQITISYPETPLGSWSATLVFERELVPAVLEVLERGQGIRRRFVVDGIRYGKEIRARGLLHIRKTNEGEFRVSVQYGGELIVRAEEPEEDEDADSDSGDDDDDDDDDDEEDDEREVVAVVARFTGQVSGTQGDDEEDED